jgi:hypothetical protein
MSWLCSQALVAAYSAENSWDGEPSVQLSVICTRHPFWYRDKTTDISRLSRFGLTFARLTESLGEDVLTWFREDFLARTYLPPERERGSREAEADCGERWHGLSVKFDPDSCGWKTHHSLFPEDLDWFSLTLPNWGMMQDGELWERTTPGLPTAENGSGSGEKWPTPCATDHKGSEKNGQLRDRLDYAVERGGTKTRQTWPTPTANAHQNPGEHGTGGPNLATAASGQLNPDWVEWLMGWPIGLTASAPLATDKFRQWCGLHGIY